MQKSKIRSFFEKNINFFIRILDEIRILELFSRITALKIANKFGFVVRFSGKYLNTMAAAGVILPVIRLLIFLGTALFLTDSWIDAANYLKSSAIGIWSTSVWLGVNFLIGGEWLLSLFGLQALFPILMPLSAPIVFCAILMTGFPVSLYSYFKGKQSFLSGEIAEEVFSCIQRKLFLTIAQICSLSITMIFPVIGWPLVLLCQSASILNGHIHDSRVKKEANMKAKRIAHVIKGLKELSWPSQGTYVESPVLYLSKRSLSTYDFIPKESLLLSEYQFLSEYRKSLRLSPC